MISFMSLPLGWSPRRRHPRGGTVVLEHNQESCRGEPSLIVMARA
jgi:hypothetical protein